MANNIVTAQVSIVGIKPLLWHAFGPDTLPLEKKERTGVAGNDPEEWRKTALVTSDGQLYVTGSYIFATILNGGKNIKRGRGSIMPAISSTLQVQEERILIDRYLPSFPNGSVCNLSKVDPPPTNSEELVYIDVRGTVNPATRARNVRYRVATKTGWRCTFTLMWDKTVVSTNEMQAALNDAGKLVGIGDARKIGMGRFDVELFRLVE